MSHPYDVFLAIEHGNLARLKELLLEDPSLAGAHDEQGVSVVLRARYRLQMDAVEVLLAHEPELDLFSAASLGRTERLAQLLDQDHSAARRFQGDGFNALQLASFFAQPACVKLLLERGADVEAVSMNGMALRPVHAAAAGKSAEALELLLEHGADPNSQQHGGWTALHAVVNNRDLRMLDSLLARGADPRLANEFGKSALELAQDKNEPTLVQRLQR